MAKKKKKKIWNEYTKLLAGLIVAAIICVLLMLCIFTIYIEADENNVRTIEGVIENPIIKSGRPTRTKWISFEIDDKAVYILQSQNKDLVDRLSRDKIKVIVTYPEYVGKSIYLHLMEARSEQIIRIVDASDGTVYFDIFEKHNQETRGTRIALLIIISIILLVIIGVFSLLLYLEISSRVQAKRKGKRKQQAKSIRASGTDLTPEQHKHPSQNRHRKKK